MSRHAMKAIVDVMAERARQLDQFSTEHDDEHDRGELAAAAACYCLASQKLAISCGASSLWPWEPQSFAPRTRRRNLIKAAALLVAEIERLDRARKEDA